MYIAPVLRWNKAYAPVLRWNKNKNIHTRMFCIIIEWLEMNIIK